MLGVELSDPALIGRLSNAGDFLAEVVARLLALSAGTQEPAGQWDGPPVRLADGSMFAGPGKTGVQHRLHATYDPRRGWFTALELTGKGRGEGENLSRSGIAKGEVAVADRNYAKTWAFRELVENEAFFCVRTGVSSTRASDPVTGAKIDAACILAALGAADSAEIPVHLTESKGVRKSAAKPPVAARLVVFKATEASLACETARIKRSKVKHGVAPRSDTKALAGVMMILTNLPPDEWPIRHVARLYRLRWQIELAFKLLKSTFQMREVPGKTPEMARSWILANLAAALIAKLLADKMAAIPPSRP